MACSRPELSRNGQQIRALCVPYRADTHGLSRLLAVSRNRCSTALCCTCHVVPKLLINTCASGGPWLRDGPGTSAGVPSPRRHRRSRPRPVGQVVHRERCSTWPTSPRPASKQARRRDGIPTPGRRPCSKQHPACNRSGPRVPPRARSQGHQRSITVTSVLCYWISANQHFAGQDHDPCPIFQAGHADGFPSPVPECLI